MTQAACAVCNAEFPEDELVYSGVGKICPSCELDQAPESFGGGDGLIVQIAAVLCAVASGLVGYTTTMVESFGGMPSSMSVFSVGFLFKRVFISGHDYVALIGGGLAIVLGAAALKAALPSRDGKGIAMGALAVVLGLFHVVLRSGYVL